MAESPVYNMLHAYALGCLNKEDVKELKTYFRSGNDFEWSELGEFQNLAALLPSILNIENPPAQIKDRVARKLYRIRDEKRKTLVDLRNITQLTTPAEKESLSFRPQEVAPQSPIPGFARVTQESLANDSGPLSEISQDDIQSILAQNEKEITNNALYQTKFELDPAAIDNWKEPHGEAETAFENVRSKVEEIKEEIPQTNIPVQEEASAPYKTTRDEIPVQHRFTREEVPPVPQMVENPIYTPAQNPILERFAGGDYDTDKQVGEYEEKSRKGIWASIIVILILVLALCGGLYFIYMQNTKNTKELERLRQQINSQTFRADANSEVMAMLNSRECKVVNLKPADENISGFGKVIMSFDMKIAYFQFAELPEPASGKAYQLWANISGSYLSLGQFTPKTSIAYEPLPKLPVIDKDVNVSFLLTEEKTEGTANNPSTKVFLSGKI